MNNAMEEIDFLFRQNYCCITDLSVKQYSSVKSEVCDTKLPRTLFIVF